MPIRCIQPKSKFSLAREPSDNAQVALSCGEHEGVVAVFVLLMKIDIDFLVLSAFRTLSPHDLSLAMMMGVVTAVGEGVNVCSVGVQHLDDVEEALLSCPVESSESIIVHSVDFSPAPSDEEGGYVGVTILDCIHEGVFSAIVPNMHISAAMMRRASPPAFMLDICALVQQAFGHGPLSENACRLPQLLSQVCHAPKSQKLYWNCLLSSATQAAGDA